MYRPNASNDPALFPIENPNPVFRAAPDGLILFANRASDSLLASWGTGVGERLPAEWQQRVSDVLATGASRRVSTPCGGRVLELDLVPIPARDYVNVYGRDVTEQEAVRQEREALLAELQRQRDLESQQRQIAEARAAELEATLDAISDGVTLYDRQGRLIRINAAAARILGYHPGEIGLSLPERAALIRATIVDDPDASLEQFPLSRALRGETVRDQLMCFQPVGDPEGTPTYVLTSAVPVLDASDEPSGVVASFSDVTELRQARDELAERVDELETLLQLLPAGIGISNDPGCKDIQVNPTLARMLAMAPDANISLSADENQRAAPYRVFDQAGRELSPDELPMQAAAARGTEIRDMVIDILRADGVKLTLLSYAVPLLAANGQPRGGIGAYVDISALRAAEAERERLLAELQERHRELALRAAEIQALNAGLEQRVQERTAELEAIFASLPDAIYIGNADGIYRTNRAALDYLGCDSIEELWDKIPALAEKVQSRDAATGQRLPPEREPFVRALQGEPVTTELLLRNLKTGQDLVVRSACAPIWLGGEVRGAVALNTDITERLRAEKMIREQAERLRILYEIDRAILAARAPHEIAQAAIEKVQQVIVAQRVTVVSFDTGSQTAEIVAENGVSSPDFRAGIRMPLVQYPMIERVREGRVAVIEDFAALPDTWPPKDITLKAGLRSATLIPLTAGGQVIGALTISRTEPGPLPSEALELALQVASSLAVALYNAQLAQQVQFSRERLKKLAHRLVERQEGERRDVANELYNDEGQRLAALLLELGFMEKDPDATPALCDRISRTKQLADGILADMHNLAVTLRPASLDRLGLMAGLRHYAEGLARRHGLSIQVEANGLDQMPLIPDAETMLYRIAQEAIMNALHHSKASQISIAAAQHEECLTLIIEDDGQGFDVAEATRSGALGILGMHERAEMLGGSLTIESAPGKGTTVYIETPVHRA